MISAPLLRAHLAALAALSGMLACAGAAGASTVSDFRLKPSGTPTSSPRPAGPVDNDNPFVGASPQPQPTAPATTVTAPAATPAPVRSPAPTIARQPAAQPQPEFGVPQTNPRLVPETPPSSAADYALPQGLPAGLAPLGANGEVGPVIPWWQWLLGGAGLFGALCLGWWLGQRRGRSLAKAGLAPEIEPIALTPRPQPAPEPSPPAIPLLREDVAPRARPTAAPRPATGDQPIALALHATKLTATLVNAVLEYRLTLINRTARPLAGVSVAGDLLGIHGQAELTDQLALNRETLPSLHIVERLDPGQATEIGGSIRLPLAAITPVIQGNATLFVPAVRLEVQGFDQEGARVAARCAFLVGQPGADATRLQPFRLDLGPRTYAELSQRPLDTAPAAPQAATAAA